MMELASHGDRGKAFTEAAILGPSEAFRDRRVLANYAVWSRLSVGVVLYIQSVSASLDWEFRPA